MTIIISYQKFINTEITRELLLPEDANHQRLGTELATIGAITYVSLPDGAVLPANQPAEIAASIVNPVTLDAATKAEVVAASPHCRLVDEQMRDQIRGSYTLEDELKFARIGVGAAMGMYTPTADELNAMTVFGTYVESVRQWGRDQRAQWGL
jgi:hypothetical protein